MNRAPGVVFCDEVLEMGRWREGHQYRKFAKPDSQKFKELTQSETGAFMLVSDHLTIYEHERAEYIKHSNNGQALVSGLRLEIERLRDALKAATAEQRPADYWLVLAQACVVDVCLEESIAMKLCDHLFYKQTRLDRHQFTVKPVWRQVQVGDKLPDDDGDDM